MGLKLRRAVTCARTSEGIVFRLGDDFLPIEGRRIGDYLQRLLPHFDGKWTAEQLCSALNEQHRETVSRLVKALQDAGMLYETAADLPVTSSENQSAYVTRVEAQSSVPFRLFSAATHNRLLVLGNVEMAVAAAEAGMEIGLPPPTIISSTWNDHLEERLNIALDGRDNPDYHVTRLDLNSHFDWDTVNCRFDTVVIAGDINRDWEQINTTLSLLPQSVPLLPFLICGARIIAGPVGGTQNTICLRCLAEYYRQRVPPAAAPSPVRAAAGVRMTGKILMQRWMDWKTGLLPADEELLFSELNLQNLEISLCPFLLNFACTHSGRSMQEMARPLDSSSALPRQFLQASLGSQVRARLRVARIPLGVDTEFIQVREKGLCRSILGLPQDRTILLYVGRLSEEQKGDMDPLLLAFRHILEENRHVHLMIAGQDSGKAYATIVDRTAKAMGLEGHVSFMLNFPHFSKPLLYSAADIFVSPADNIQETFGLVLVEALAAGLPIVASDWSGYRDIVSRENGFTVPTLWDSSASAMISSIAPLSGFNATRHFLAQRTILDTGELYRSLKMLVDNPDLRQKLGAASRERALQEFAWPRIIEQYDQLWREQQERLELEKAGEALPGFCLDYEKLFRHFATEVLNPGVVLQVNPCNAQVVMRPDILRAKLPSSLHPDHVSLVMDQLENGKSLTIGNLMSAPRGCSMAAIAWLMKKGALEIKRTPDIVET